MNFLLDNNLPPALASGLDALCQGNNNAVRVIHLKSKFPQDTADHVWIRTLADEGNWAIVSQDGFRKNDLEREAIRRCGLPVFVLSKQWSGRKYWDKAQNLVRWWPAIEDYTQRVQGGAAVRVPWRFGTVGRFEQIRL
ncbi:hypothetical protein [Castellaniella sp.]|uniref:PIN-like domain-containing protein n=1 Tax=Castellaniella sp. TaxID=1955812 RepID=UPI002AFE53F1|nr:hypothetical protein [Castellaniella sp.]